MIAPKDESRDLVMQWLETEGVASELSARGDAVVVKGSINQIEKLLSTEYIPFGKFFSPHPHNIAPPLPPRPPHVAPAIVR